MTDECFRSKRSSRVADQMVYLLNQLGIPRYLDPIKRFQLAAFQILGKPFAFLFVPMATFMLRKETSTVILPGEKEALSKHMHRRRAEGVRLNLNHLGEAILSEREALHRLNTYLNDLGQDDIEYISIKISTIYSQINLLAWDKTLEILSERLRQLYRAAMNHTFMRADGSKTVKFVNLDMEEYRDLILTKDLFIKVLSEPEFHRFSAGIVLQAYLPDSHNIQKELTEWAMNRIKQGGAPVKIRIVKGANLAMEQFEASLRDWPQAPYTKKNDVDANYKRMVVYGCKPEHAKAVHLGIASHNLFDIAFALLQRAENEVEMEINFEMLEGMADHIRKVVQILAKDMLLYCPIATREDFQSAVAYLIRRLDENTGPDNFLRHTFGLKPDTPEWKAQADLFALSCKKMDQVSLLPRRTQNRLLPPTMLPMQAPFENESDTDFALPHNREWANRILSSWKNRMIQPIPLVIGGQEIQEAQPSGTGIDPSFPGKTLYRYSMADWSHIDQALNIAKAEESSWSSTSVEERCRLLANAAQKMRERRSELIGVMVADGGKTIVEGDPEVSEAIDFADYYLRSIQKMHQCKDIQWKAKGTILVAPPWNFPISIPAGGILAALACGNCVIFKPAPEAVLSGWVLVNALWDAGISKNVLQFINCPDEPVGSKLIADPRVAGVILTGATSTAKLFLRLRPGLDLFAETGGKNAFIITSMSDRDLAIKDLIQSAFGHSGQKCSAASLAIIEAEVYDDPHFKQQLRDAAESLTVGSPWDLSSKVVPLIHEPNETLMRGLTTLENGEEWLVKPKQDPHNLNLWSPGIKWGVKEGSFMHTTELFGPVLGVLRAKNLEHAVRLANATPYGLTSGIHSLDERERAYWIQHIEAGNCYINRTVTGAIVRRQPFGGCKASGYGTGAKAGGPNYVHQFALPKEVALPPEKHPVSPEVEKLTHLIEKQSFSKEQLGAWYASIANYAYWAEHFSHKHDPSKIVGQDNFLMYRVQPRIVFRIQDHDSPMDVLRTLAAALSVKNPLEVSWQKSNNSLNITDQWRHLLSSFRFVEESEGSFLHRVKSGAFKRIRLLSAPSQDLNVAAAASATHIAHLPALS
ncbi:MAG TPA: bifunctional proline dehydrogenase/L-glutamate gamma-semialdehyde dehydrogenase, partial [Rhabdochlamydiaceae bacterium]